jgi:hypothetical protein
MIAALSMQYFILVVPVIAMNHDHSPVHRRGSSSDSSSGSSSPMGIESKVSGDLRSIRVETPIASRLEAKKSLPARTIVLLIFDVIFLIAFGIFYILTINVVMDSHKGASNVELGPVCSIGQRNILILMFAMQAFAFWIVTSLTSPRVGGAFLFPTRRLARAQRSSLWMHQIGIAVPALIVLIMTILMLVDHFSDANQQLYVEAMTPVYPPGTFPSYDPRSKLMRCPSMMVFLIESLTTFGLMMTLPILLNVQSFIYLPLKTALGM